MSQSFTRTPTGIVAKWQFHNVPTVWVEGPTDIFFYPPALRGLRFRIEAFHGCGNAKALIDGILKFDLPYLVIMDGDYGILNPRRSDHRRIIVLKRYSFENYLWHVNALNYACRRHAQSGDQVDVLSDEMARLERHISDVFRTAVEIDVASIVCNPAPKILPDAIEQLLVSPSNPDVDPVKVNNFVGASVIVVPAQEISEAKKRVQKFLETRPFIDLFKGHLLLGVLCRMFCKRAAELKGSSAPIRQDALVQILSDAVWSIATEPDYKTLRSKMRKQLRSCSEHPKMEALMT